MLLLWMLLAVVAVLALGIALVVVLRQRWLAHWLGLPPASFAVAVERNLPVSLADGTNSLADHYYPRGPGRYSTILIRSPWGRGWENVPYSLTYLFFAHRFAERGYHVVIHSLREKPPLTTAGANALLPDTEAADGQAVLAWIAAQPWFNGKLGMWGASILGHVQWAAATDAPPALRALVPITTTSDWSAFFVQDGALALERLLHTVALLENTRQPVWKVFAGAKHHGVRLAQAAQHLPLAEADTVLLGQPVPAYRDSLAKITSAPTDWQSIDHRASTHHTTAAVQCITGWYDLFLREALTDYAALRDAGRNPALIVGPWHHTSPGLVAASLRAGVAWFGTHLNGNAPAVQPPVQVAVMGADTWRSFVAWPPPSQEQYWFLHPDGVLSPDPPAPAAAPTSYTYDPADPTPLIGGSLMSEQAGPRDQRPLEARPDVLCYTSAPLTAPLEIIGAVRLEVSVQSSVAHTDFVGRLCVVQPDGTSLNLCEGLCRVAPDNDDGPQTDIRRITIDLWATAYRFGVGQRVRLHVASAAHPRWIRHSNTRENPADATHLVAATQTIHHAAAHRSVLVLPLVEAG